MLGRGEGPQTPHNRLKPGGLCAPVSPPPILGGHGFQTHRSFGYPRTDQWEESPESPESPQLHSAPRWRPSKVEESSRHTVDPGMARPVGLQDQTWATRAHSVSPGAMETYAPHASRSHPESLFLSCPYSFSWHLNTTAHGSLSGNRGWVGSWGWGQESGSSLGS